MSGPAAGGGRSSLAYKIATEVQGGNALTVGWKRVHDIVEKHVGEDDDFVADLARQAEEHQQAAIESREQRIAFTARVAELEAALRKLESAGSEVSRWGAAPGPQWVALTGALLSARAALAKATTP